MNKDLLPSSILPTQKDRNCTPILYSPRYRATPPQSPQSEAIFWKSQYFSFCPQFPVA